MAIRQVHATSSVQKIQSIRFIDFKTITQLLGYLLSSPEVIEHSSSIHRHERRGHLGEADAPQTQLKDEAYPRPTIKVVLLGLGGLVEAPALGSQRPRPKYLRGPGDFEVLGGPTIGPPHVLVATRTLTCDMRAHLRHVTACVALWDVWVDDEGHPCLDVDVEGRTMVDCCVMDRSDDDIIVPKVVTMVSYGAVPDVWLDVVDAS